MTTPSDPVSGMSAVAKFLVTTLVGVILGGMSGLYAIAVRHEGIIGEWKGLLAGIQHSLERIEKKLDRN